MNKNKNNLLLTLILVVIWLILNGRKDPLAVFTGLIMAVITIKLLNLLHPHQSDLYDYHINPLGLLVFLAVLVKNIYISAFKTIINLRKGQIKPQFVTTTTKINRPWLQSIIGNAITLTPGTVTLHLADRHYVVLWLYPDTKHPNQIKEELLGDFERALAKGDTHA